jgi:molybdenum cofactor cytidylyltransferase
VLGCEVADRPPASQTAETAVGPDSGGRLSSKREQADRVKGPIERELLGLPIVIVKNENWRAGIGTSIRAGVQSLIDNNEAVAAMILLVCDQPFVDAHTIEQLTAIREKTNKPIVATSYSGTVGVPALFDRSYFDELLTLPDDSGAKPIILRDEAGVATFSFPAGNIDIDTWTDYEKLSGRHFQPL